MGTVNKMLAITLRTLRKREYAMQSLSTRIRTVGALAAAGALVFALASLSGIAPGDHVPPVSAGQSSQFGFTGSAQDYVVPDNVQCVTIDAYGAAGGEGANPDGPQAQGGLGGRATATIPVTPGETLQVYVGGQGGTPAAGFNGGGAGGDASQEDGGGGGGASDVRRAPYGLPDRLVVAGGGGGGGGDADPGGAEGGAGGGLTGADGSPSGSSPETPAGGGGTQTAGGAAPTSFDPTTEAGSLGQGGQGGIGPSNDDAGAGGGGGYYGGAGGAGEDDDVPTDGGAGGGGGSGFGPAGVSFETGVRPGDGLVEISDAGAECLPTPTPTPTPAPAAPTPTAAPAELPDTGSELASGSDSWPLIALTALVGTLLAASGGAVIVTVRKRR